MSSPGHQAALGQDGRLLLTLGEVASRLGTGPLGIERLVNEGYLTPTLRDDRGRTWFEASDVDAVAAGTAERGSRIQLRAPGSDDSAGDAHLDDVPLASDSDAGGEPAADVTRDDGAQQGTPSEGGERPRRVS